MALPWKSMFRGVMLTKNTPPKELLQKVRKIFQEKEAKRQAFIERHGHIKPPNVIRCFDNKTASVLDGGIYFQTRETTYYFSNVIHDHALIFLGNEFLESEEAKPFELRHPAMQWLQIVCDDEEIHKNSKIENKQEERRGVGVAWFRFAYDLFTVRDNAKLEAYLKKKLLNREMFQGARHELRVATICMAAGFTIEFEDETDVNNGHLEFIAKDIFSNTRITVEAKSKHRKGVLGFQQGRDVVAGSEVHAKNMVLEAYKKPAKFPFNVFIDVNLPPYSNEDQFNSWLMEIYDTMMGLAEKRYADPCPANAIFFCNDPSYYIMDRPLSDPTDQLWIKHFTAEKPRMPHPSNDVVERLMKAYTQRIVPPEDIDFS
jgi:hypothetical protein